MGKQTLQPSTVMTMRERRQLAKLQKKDQERRRKEKRDRLNASEFGAATTDAALGRSSTRKAAVRVEKKSLKPTSTYTADTVKKAKQKKEGDSRYRPGKGSIAAAAGLKLTKKPNNTANASTSTTKKKDTPPVSMPKSRPKRKTPNKTPKSSYDEVKPQKKTAKKPTKTTTPTTKSRDKDGLGKKPKTALPAGAKPFKGSYNSKTHKLKNIRGKTYVVKK